MLETLKNSTFVWAVLSICTLLGIPSFIFAVVTWYKGRTKKELSVSKTSWQIIQSNCNNYDDLEILYKGRKVEDLTLTQFIVWNSGNKELRRDDLASGKPLQINVGRAARLLNVSLIENSDSSNGFICKEYTERCADFDFEYIDRNEGVIFQLLHTGASKDLQIDCKIIGGSKLKEFNHHGSTPSYDRIGFYNACAMLIMLGISIISLSIYFFSVPEVFFSLVIGPNRDPVFIISGLLFIFILFLVVILAVNRIKAHLHLMIPASLRHKACPDD